MAINFSSIDKMQKLYLKFEKQKNFSLPFIFPENFDAERNFGFKLCLEFPDGNFIIDDLVKNHIPGTKIEWDIENYHLSFEKLNIFYSSDQVTEYEQKTLPQLNITSSDDKIRHFNVKYQGLYKNNSFYTTQFGSEKKYLIILKEANVADDKRPNKIYLEFNKK